MHRRLVVLGALLACALVGPVSAFAQEATPSAQTPAVTAAATNARLVVPFTPDGLSPGLTVVAREDGVCGFESIAAFGRPDAWDCIGANDQVYDPCFENPFIPPDEMGELACFESPFTTDVVLLSLTAPLVREKEDFADAGGGSAMGMAQDAETDPWDLPWSLELANGDQCTLLHGTLPVFAGQIVHYGCIQNGMVLGETDRSHPVWTVSYLAEDAYATNVVEVVTAWS